MCAVRSPVAPHSDWFPSRSDTSTSRISAIAVPRITIGTGMIPNGIGFPRFRHGVSFLLAGASGRFDRGLWRLPTGAGGRQPARQVSGVDAAGRELGAGEQGAVQVEVRGDPVDGAPVQGVAQYREG